MFESTPKDKIADNATSVANQTNKRALVVRSCPTWGGKLPIAIARKTSQSKAKRAKIILTTSENPDWTDVQVAQTVGCSPALVRKWRKRWCQTRSLEEAARPGRPRIFQAIVRAQVTKSLAANQRIVMYRWRDGVAAILRHS